MKKSAIFVINFLLSILLLLNLIYGFTFLSYTKGIFPDAGRVAPLNLVRSYHFSKVKVLKQVLKTTIEASQSSRPCAKFTS